MSVCVSFELSPGVDQKLTAYSLQSSLVVVQLLSCVPLFATPWTPMQQAPLSFTVSWSLLELKSIESVMPPKYHQLNDNKIQISVQSYLSFPCLS